jgi:hypothetical protein
MFRTTAALTMLGAAILFTGCADVPGPTEPHAAPAAAVTALAAIDIGGSWSYDETTVLIMKPDGQLHGTCRLPDGVLTIVQDGSTFTGTLIHSTTTCTSRAGDPLPAPWDLPYVATVSGRITGRALHIEQQDAPPAMPVQCTKNGVISVVGGAAVALRTTGRCDLSFLPFPAVANNSAIGTRL